MGSAASSDSPVLVMLRFYLLLEPVQYVGLEDFTGKHGAGNVPEVVDRIRVSLLRNYSYKFLLPDDWPDPGDGYTIKDIRQRNCQQVAVLRYKSREYIPLDH